MEPLDPDDPRELGRYRLLRRIGEGGMGIVFLAIPTDGDGDDLAAVKAIRPEYAGDGEFRARFTSEVDLARRVRGPYTARVLDADTDSPTPWLATEYVPGPALHQAVRENGPFPEKSLLALAAGLTEALSAIHSVGLIHRDLKPSNVLLASRGPQVIDFGIARATDATALTRTGQTLGTPAYMSPEQATGADLDVRSDLFAFGGVLLFAATGRAPFGTGDPAALLYRVVNQPPDLNELPETLVPLVTACLAKNPDDRPDLDTVTAQLINTVLPRNEDAHATEWLPKAIATTIHHTLVAATRVAPTSIPPEQDDHADAAPALPPASHSVKGTEEAITEAPAHTGPEPNSEEPGSRPNGRPAPRPQAPVQHPSAHASMVSGPAQVDADRSSSSKVFWSALVAAIVSVVVVGMALNFSADPTTQAQPDPVGRDTNETARSPSPSPSPFPTNALPRDFNPQVQDTAFLSGPDRFAVLSNAGLDVFEADRTEPIERLTERLEGYHFGGSELVSTPDGSVVAAKALKSAGDGVAAIHVWEIDESERHILELPSEIGDGGYIALSPDGETLFLGGNFRGGSKVSAYRVRTGEELYDVTIPESEQGWSGAVHGVGTSPDGELLIAALSTGLAVWDAASGEPHPSYPELREWPDEITGPVAFGDGVVATATFESLLLWDVRSNDEPEEFRLPADEIEASVRIREVSIGDEGRRIVAAGRDTDLDHSLLIVWDAEGRVLVEDRSERDYSSLNASPVDDRLLIAFGPLGQEGREAFMFLGEDLETTQEFQIPGH
ncbi:WD40 repeat domain-containing serine/threonine protein kinase [Nocardiopsis sp. NPDC049922]|uniref:WD40 repeat domain-containing serine/threonine protein kinase n=1 Tax=Nocardiopsis sp. NPDC049922 TaxID=3155157 RepID=UPI0033ECCC33